MKSLSSLLSVVLVPLLITGQLPAENPSVSPAPTPALHVRLVSGNSLNAAVGSQPSDDFIFQVTDAKGAPVANAAVVLRLPDSGATGIFTDGTHSAVAYTNESGQADIGGIQWGEETGTAAMRVTATNDTAHAGILLEQSITPAIAKTAALPSIPLIEPSYVPSIPRTSSPKIAPADLVRPEATQPGAIAMPTSNIPLGPKIQVQSNIDSLPPIATTGSGAAPAPAEPSVSVNNAPGANQGHSSKTKWIILAAVVAAGGAAGALMMGKGKSSTPSSTASLTIGTPTVSIGH